MQDRPDAPELLAAVAQYLFEDLLPEVPREHRFHVRVAANCCAIVAREWESTPEATAEEAARLLELVGQPRDAWLAETDSGRRHLADAGEFRALQQEVAQAIRAGGLDQRWDVAVDVLRESVKAKLAVAHPGWTDVADDGRG